MPDRPSLRRHFSWTFIFLIIALAMIGATVFLLERCMSLPARTVHSTVEEMERAGRDLRDALVQIAQLQPRVTINERVYFEQASTITELALVSQRLEVEHEFLHKWAGSTKRLKLHGTFTAKAGFDLRQPFSVAINPGYATIRIPHAQLLGLEQNGIDVLAYENGFWNPISGTDVQSELAALNKIAHDRALERKLPAEAERLLRSQILSRVPNVPDLQIIFYDANSGQ